MLPLPGIRPYDHVTYYLARLYGRYLRAYELATLTLRTLYYDYQVRPCIASLFYLLKWQVLYRAIMVYYYR